MCMNASRSEAYTSTDEWQASRTKEIKFFEDMGSNPIEPGCKKSKKSMKIVQKISQP